MPTPPITRETCLQAVSMVKVYIDRGYELAPGPGYRDGGRKSAVTMAAEDAGIPPGTLRSRLVFAKERFGLTPENYKTPLNVRMSEDRPDPIELLDRHAPVNTAYIARKRTKPTVITVKPEPFCVAFVGDPHITNAGCELAALRADMELLRATGTRAIQMGDILDNFHRTAKLAPKEALNRMSIEEGLSLAEWLVCESGVKWDAHILGNHDLWMGPEGVALLAEWVRRAQSRLYDWNGRIIYRWGDGPKDYHTVAAAHDFKGYSQYNPTHGPGKMALWDGTADTYVAAHRHNHAEAKVPNGWRGKTYQLIRVRGYKDYDSYAAGRAQFADHIGMEGRSAILVVNPLAETHDGKQRSFMDLAEGIEFCEMLKRRAKI